MNKTIVKHLQKNNINAWIVVCNAFEINIMPEINNNNVDPYIHIRDTLNKVPTYDTTYKVWQIVKQHAQDNTDPKIKGIELSEYQITTLIQKGLIRGEINTSTVNGKKKTTTKVCLEDALFASRFQYIMQTPAMREIIDERTLDDGTNVFQVVKVLKNKTRLEQISELFFKASSDIFANLSEVEIIEFIAKYKTNINVSQETLDLVANEKASIKMYFTALHILQERQ